MSPVRRGHLSLGVCRLLPAAKGLGKSSCEGGPIQKDQAGGRVEMNGDNVFRAGPFTERKTRLPPFVVVNNGSRTVR